MADFSTYIGIDYSGAGTAISRLKGLQVYSSQGSGEPVKVPPPGSPRNRTRNWSRKEIAAHIVELADSDEPLIIGIDHCFSFPLSYFERYGLTGWDSFLRDFTRHWSTHEEDAYVDFLKEDNRRTGSHDEFRITEQRTSSAKSVFLFGVPGQTAKSSHAGIPWLLYIREKCGDAVHFWPFDGWDIPDKKHVILEVYPSILRRRYPGENRTGDEHDAWSVSRWLSESDRQNILKHYFHPPLSEREREIAVKEGWILGIC